jgi:site-specific DNA recombinase
MRIVALYVRVSTDEQAEVEEGSLKNQQENLKRWVQGENLKHNGSWGQIYEIYIDDGYSAKSLQRPQLKRMLQDITKGKIDTVLITEVSRLSRNVRDWIDLRDFFDKHNVAFITLRQNFDTSNAMGRAMLSFAIQFAQLEREQTAERVKVSAQARAMRGLWTGGPIPYGLRATDRPGYLAVDLGKQLIAEQIFDILINKAGYLSKTVEIITEAGYLRDSGDAWTVPTLASWIKIYALIGKVQVNTRNKDTDQSKLRDSDKYQVVDAVWGPVIEESVWIQANELLERNYRRLKVPQWKNHEFLFSGVLECAEGRKFSGTSGTARNGSKFVQYRHGKSEAGNCPCDTPTVRAEEIEDTILQALRKLAKDSKVVEALVEKANVEFNARKPDLKEALITANKKLTGLLKKLESTTDLALEASTESERRLWLEKAQRIQGEKDQAELEIEEIERKKESFNSSQLNADDIIEGLQRFDDDFDDLPVASKQRFINAILEKIIINADHLVLVVKNPNLKLEEFDITADLECKSGVQFKAHKKQWLPDTGLGRTDFPPDQISNFIEFNVIPLYRQESFLRTEYLEKGRSIHEIASEIFASRSAVSASMRRLGIPFRTGDQIQEGQLAFGQRIKNGHRICHKKENDTLRHMSDLRQQGFSYHKIADILNTLAIPTKCRKSKWHGTTVMNILKSCPAHANDESTDLSSK